MAHGRTTAVITALWAAFAATLASGVQAQKSVDPSDSTPLPRTTTQEAQVNKVGLSEPPKFGWHTDYIGPLRGVFDLSIGMRLWPDQTKFRYLALGGAVDLAPGVRARVGLRRRDGEDKAFEVYADEIYLEIYNQYRAPTWNGGAQLRIGHARYLHFPYPDAISQFDQVPGVADLDQRVETDYRSIVLQAEGALNSGWGAHFTARASGFVDPFDPVYRTIEAYGFYRSDFGRGWHFESRAGGLAVRREPLGRATQAGYNVYVGKQFGEFNVGLLYERKRTEPEFSGLMVQFRPTPVTRAMGKVMLDYSRSPGEGFTVQLPIWHGRLNESRFVRSGDILVGEVRAVRMRTLWQQGFVRNEYEHRLASWGETSGPRLHCVVIEEPWFLQTEALVSPHLTPDARWEHDRQGPGQYVQRVTYRYYRPKPATGNGA